MYYDIKVLGNYLICGKIAMMIKVDNRTGGKVYKVVDDKVIVKNRDEFINLISNKHFSMEFNRVYVNRLSKKARASIKEKDKFVTGRYYIGRKVVCYISVDNLTDKFILCEGRPSSKIKVLGTYDEIEDAVIAADLYLIGGVNNDKN